MAVLLTYMTYTLSGSEIINKLADSLVSWCSWLSRQSNTLKVSGSSPGEIIHFLGMPFLSFSLFSLNNLEKREWI